MIQQYLGISPDKLIKAGWETLYMVGFSLIIGSIVGFFIAIVLWLTRKGGLKENPLLYTILKYSLQGTTQGNGLTGGVPPVRFSM